jgi:hypothetical protein
MGEWEDLQEDGAREDARAHAVNALIEAGLSGALTWSQVEAAAEVINIDRPVELVFRRGRVVEDYGGDHKAAFADFLRDVATTRFTESQLHSLPLVLRAGGKPWEFIPLGVHGRNCQGEDLALIDDDLLLGRRDGALMLEQAFGASPWLASYIERLQGEVRDRAQRQVPEAPGAPEAVTDGWARADEALEPFIEAPLEASA